jgi:hypothetical protein
MVLELDKYLGIRYNKKMGPEKIPDQTSARRLGINCAALAHLINEELFRTFLPDSLGPVEWWFDNKHYRFLDPFEEPQLGDVAFFGTLNANPRIMPDGIKGNSTAVRDFIRKYPAHHIAVYAGRKIDGSAVFIHSTIAEKGVAIWTQDMFSKYRSPKGNPLYEVLYGFKRIKNDGLKL